MNKFKYINLSIFDFLPKQWQFQTVYLNIPLPTQGLGQTIVKPKQRFKTYFHSFGNSLASSIKKKSVVRCGNPATAGGLKIPGQCEQYKQTYLKKRKGEGWWEVMVKSACMYESMNMSIRLSLGAKDFLVFSSVQ